MKTVETIIKESASTVLGLNKDELSNDIIDIAVDKYNYCGRIIFDAWPWKEKKIDQFNATADATTGVILFNGTHADVDIVRAVKALSTDDDFYDTFIWPQDEVSAAIIGEEVSSARFITLNHDASGYRRIQVNPDDEVTTYAVLAMKRFVEATVESTYDPASPSTTPTDYRYLTWKLEDANSILISFVMDELKIWDGQNPTGQWKDLMRIPIAKAELQEAKEHISYPASSDVGEIGKDF